MRVSFFSGLATVALLATSAVAVQLGNDLPQPMEVAEIHSHQSSTSQTKASASTGNVDDIINNLKSKGESAKNINKTTEMLNEKERKDKDKQIEQLRTDAEHAALKNKLTELERERKAKEEEEKRKALQLDPETWLSNHPDKAKLEILIKKEAKLVANKIIEQKKKDKKKAQEALEKKGKDAEQERAKIVAEVSAAVKAAATEEKQAASTPPNPPQYGTPVTPQPVPAATVVAPATTVTAQAAR